MVDRGIMLTNMRKRPHAPGAPRLDVINHGLPISDPTQFFLNFHGSAIPPNGSNWSVFRNPHQVDELLSAALRTFAPAVRDPMIAKAHELVVGHAPWMFIVHDLNPRALSPRVRGFRQAQSWYQDFTQVTLAE
jgi:peptide/nickel transport system substrate-binding protein